MYFLLVLVCGWCALSAQAYKSYNQQQQRPYETQQQHAVYPNSGYGNNVGKSILTQTMQTQQKSFQVINEWKYLDFEYSTYEQRRRAIENR